MEGIVTPVVSEADRDAIRSQFPTLAQDLVFLENAGGSQVPAVVADSIRDYMLSTYVQLGAGYPLSHRCTEIVDDNLCVTYTTIGDWELDQYHLWVGGDVADMPQNKFGSPKLGRFPYKETSLSGWETPVTTKTVCIAPEELGLNEWCDLEEVKVVAHAVVARDGDKDGILDTFPTGFGDGFDLGGARASAKKTL